MSLGAPLGRQDTAVAAADRVFASACRGAATMAPGSTCVQANDGLVNPRVADAAADRSRSYKYRCQTVYDFTDRFTCEFGDRRAARNVALVGNSHAVHWLPALHEIGLREGFKVTTFLSAVCSATTTRIAMPKPKQTENCRDWGEWARESAASGDFDLIVQSDRVYLRPQGGGDPDAVYERGFRKHLRTWADAGRTVLVIRGIPVPLSDIPSCLQRNPHDYRACSGTRAAHLRTDPLARAAQAYPSNKMRVANLTDYFCTEQDCRAVIGRVIVYSDASHMTATYSRSLAPYLKKHVVRALRVDAAARAHGKGYEPARHGGARR